MRGVAWYGGPMPLRVWFFIKYKVWPKKDGCGCVKIIKDLWSRMRSW